MNNEPNNNAVKMSAIDILNLKKVKYLHDRKMLVNSETNDVVENLSRKDLINLVQYNCNSAKKYSIRSLSKVAAAVTTPPPTTGDNKRLTLFNGVSDDFDNFGGYGSSLTLADDDVHASGLITATSNLNDDDVEGGDGVKLNSLVIDDNDDVDAVKKNNGVINLFDFLKSRPKNYLSNKNN